MLCFNVLNNNHCHRPDMKTHGKVPEYGALSRLCDPVILFVERNNLSEAKICNFHQCLTRHQDISGCKISVHVAKRLQVLHPLKK